VADFSEGDNRCGDEEGLLSWARLRLPIGIPVETPPHGEPSPTLLMIRCSNVSYDEFRMI
jgi:hypothetical protein